MFEEKRYLPLLRLHQRVINLQKNSTTKEKQTQIQRQLYLQHTLCERFVIHTCTCELLAAVMLYHAIIIKWFKLLRVQAICTRY